MRDGTIFPTQPMRRLLQFSAIAILSLSAGVRAGTVVHLGSVNSFTGPTDPNLDLTGLFDYAVNFSANDPQRTVNGLVFKPDTQAIPGASFIGPQNVAPWQAKPEFGSSTDANELEEIMHDIRWANNGSGEKLQASLAVTPGIPYKIQILISGNNPEARRWDIRLNGQNAVDEITSLGIGPGGTYASNRCTVWTHEFVPASTPMVVEMGNFFGGNDGGDRNPIWQALTLESVYIPPAPDDLTLSPLQFFPGQTGYIGQFAVTDGKFAATHTLSLVAGAGSTDNAKFSLSGAQLLPSPFNFSAAAPGTSYSIRARATDAADGARFIEKTFSVSLAAPHAPTAVGLNAASLSSGLLAGQAAGILSATDPDTFDRHTFTLVAGAGADQNSLFTVVGNELRLASALPGALASVSLRVRATDLSGLSVETALVLPLVEPRVRINEILAVSTAATLPLDQNSLTSDWIELHNELAQPVNLAGWRLTDDADVPAKWTLPAVTIAPNGYLLIFASGSGVVHASGPPHTNFSLSQGGERLLLSRPDGVVLSDVNPPEMYPNGTWGVAGGGTESGYLRTPTPGAVNSPLAAAGRNDVIFSVPHGFKTAAFPLTLTATVPGSTIRYTLDGTQPGPASPVYSAPLNITPVAGTVKSGTRIVRAFATHPDAAYTPVTTQTYLFVNGVTSPTANGIVGQSNFVSSIRTHATYGPLIDDALLALPALSIVNSSSDLPYAETESSMELIDPQGIEPGFTIPAGIIRSGTTSLGYAKGSMSARFRGEYGATKLVYPVYGLHPHDPLGAVTEFQELRLRSGSHDTHSWLGTAENPPVPYGSPSVTRSGDAQYVRNIWAEDMQLLMGQPGKHGRMVNMFVNGNYYGMYHIQEHADDDYMGTYYPGTSEDYHFTGAATTGSTHGSESWSTIWAQMKASLSNYTQAKRWVDVTNLADCMVLSYYIGNDWDWTAQHNWGAAGPRLPDWGGWKFFLQDQDISLQDVNADCTDQTVPDGVFHALMAHADFKVLFRDRVYRHLFHDGVLTPAKAAGYYQLRTNEISTAIVAETARWQPSSSVGALPWDRDGEWTVEKNYLMNTFFPQRTAKLLTQLRARGWYPVDAPEMSQHGGAVAAGSQILLTGPAGATLYYTLDGSDPRLPGGAVSPSAIAYTATTSTQVLVSPHDGGASTGAVWKYLAPAADPGASWKDLAYDDSAWPSGATEFGYGEADQITTVPTADTDPVTAGEQRNLTTYFRRTFSIASPGAVSGMNIRLKRDDGAVVYINGREVFRSAMQTGEITFSTPGNSGVNVADDGNTWFTKALVPADYTLQTGTNVIAVEVHNSFATSSDITFDLELTGTMPVTPQPILINSAALLKARARVGTEWSGLNEASFYLTGTQPASTANLTISEIHYNPEGAGGAEFIEFMNTGANPVDANGVQIGGAVLFTFPPGTVLLPGERVVVVSDAAQFDVRYRTVGSPWYRAGIRVAGAWSGSLSNGGEEIIVLSATDAPVFTFSYDDTGAWPGRADGSGSSLELVDPMAAPLSLPEKAVWLGGAGSWRPSSEFHGSPGYAGAGPDNRIVINEVLSASVTPAVDFIELLNISGVSQSVGNWFLSDSADNFRKYRLPAGTSLAPGARLVLTENQFGNAADAGALVPFSLSSAGDDVYLLEADSAGNLLRFADRVEFSAAPGSMPWGRAPDGTGSVELLRSTTPGAVNSASIPQYAVWAAAEFPAGTASAVLDPGADPDQDGLTNLAEFAFRLSPVTPDGSPLTLLPVGGGSPLQFAFTVRNDIPGLSARIDTTADLSLWETTETTIERVSEVPNPNATTTVTARLLPSAAARMFLRVTISL